MRILQIVTWQSMHFYRFSPLGTCTEEVYDEHGRVMSRPWPATHADRRDFVVTWDQLKQAIDVVATCPEATGEASLEWTERCLHR